MTSERTQVFKPHLPKILPSNAIILGIQFQRMTSERTQVFRPQEQVKTNKKFKPDHKTKIVKLEVHSSF